MVFVVQQQRYEQQHDEEVAEEDLLLLNDDNGQQPIPGTSTWQAHPHLSRFSSGSKGIKDTSPQLATHHHGESSDERSFDKDNKYVYQRNTASNNTTAKERPCTNPQLQQMQRAAASTPPRTTTTTDAPKRRPARKPKKEPKLKIPTEIEFLLDGDYEPSESNHPQDDTQVFYDSCSSISSCSSCSTDLTDAGQAPSRYNRNSSRSSPPPKMPSRTWTQTLDHDASLHITDDGIMPKRKSSWDTHRSNKFQQSNTQHTEAIGESWSTFQGPHPAEQSFAVTPLQQSYTAATGTNRHRHTASSSHLHQSLPPSQPYRRSYDDDDDEEDEIQQLPASMSHLAIMSESDPSHKIRPPRKPLSSDMERRRIMEGLERRHTPSAAAPLSPRRNYDRPPSRTTHPSHSSRSSPFSSLSSSRSPSSSPPNHYHHHNPVYSSTASVEISPGHFVPLRTSAETRHAIARDFYTPVTCAGCAQSIFCISDAEFVLCPHCTVVSAVHTSDNDDDDEASNTERHGVGLGFTMECLFKEQNAILAQRQQQRRSHSPPPPSMADSSNRWNA